MKTLGLLLSLFAFSGIVVADREVAAQDVVVDDASAPKVATPPNADPSDLDSTNRPVATGEVEVRRFEFHYGGTIEGLPDDAEVKVWLPVAESNRQQTVSLKESTTPTPLKINRDADYQNQIGSFHWVADGQTEPRFRLTYDVTRRPATAYQIDSEDQKASGSRNSSAPQAAVIDDAQFLKANRTVPITGKPIELIKGMTFPKNSTMKARKLYDLVFDHMAYDKSNPGYGNGDSVWACDSRTGNCTDFHSLFISLSRNQSLASKFEIGFPVPTDRSSGKIGGYHCWAWFLSPEQGWVPVDISEADKHPELKDQLFGYLPPDRITFSSGRDIVLVPASTAGPQNFFVYPHVEVNGEVWPKDKIKLDFSFEANSEAN